MTSQVKVRLSWGLIALVAVNAILIVALQRVSNTNPPRNDSQQFRVPARGYEPIQSTTRIEALREAPNVNLQAQGELKQAGPCLPCDRPEFINGERVVGYGPSVPVASVSYPASIAAPGQSQPQQSKPRFQIILFLDSSPESQRLTQWFATDSSLSALRAKCEYQVFTADNPLYLARYESIVPASQFPVVLFQDPTGGHVHAAGGSMIPGNASTLHADMAKGFELYKQAKQGGIKQTGAIKSAGYSWDDNITPSLRMSDCPDGQCPTPDQQWRPFDRLRDDGDLFGGEPLRNAFAWFNSGELATVALFAIAFVLLLFVLFKHRGR